MKKEPSVTTPIEVRFADLDAYGHVNNAVYFTYLETARVTLFREDFSDLIEEGLQFLVVEASCRYRKPIGLNDEVLVDISPVNPGRSSFTLDYRLHNGSGTLFAEARTVMVCFDTQKGKAVSLPDSLRLGFETQLTS
jgi:acyl-CoA thioester hydrolase